MGVFQKISREVELIGGLRRTLKALGEVSRDSADTVGDDLERAVDRFADNIAFEFEGAKLTYAQFDALANRYARWARAQGLARGECVALFMNNRPEFVAAWMGLAKVGVATALINNTQTGKALAHSIEIAEARCLILGAELAEAYHAVSDQLSNAPAVWATGGPVQGAQDLDERLRTFPGERIPREEARPGLSGADMALYVYTSGTTGLPKAAKMPHWRCVTMMRAFPAAGAANEQDRVYLTLPLYHAPGGLCGVGFALNAGGTVLLRRKFSATHFWPDVREQKATVFFYIGELCRYLVSQPPHPEDGQHGLRVAVGNGLRPEVWERFQPRFKIPKVLEFYGSTEGNVSMMNYDGKIGAIGRIPFYLRNRFNIRLVKFDIEREEPVRGSDGLCVECEPGEPGEALGEIKSDDVRFRFGFTFDQCIPRQQVTGVAAVNHHWWKGIGWKLGPGVVALLGDSAGVVEVRLREPRRVRLLGIPWRYQRLRVSLQDPEAFINELRVT